MNNFNEEEPDLPDQVIEELIHEYRSMLPNPIPDTSDIKQQIENLENNFANTYQVIRDNQRTIYRNLEIRDLLSDILDKKLKITLVKLKNHKDTVLSDIQKSLEKQFKNL